MQRYFFPKKLFLITFGLILFSFPTVQATSLQGKCIVVDAGHGVLNFYSDVINSGQISRDGKTEHRIAFQMTQKLGEELKKEGARVIFTRTPETYWRQAYSSPEDNKNRALFANEMKADALLSIHCDWDSRSRVNGVTTLFEKENSRQMGERIHSRMIKDLKAKDRKLVQDNFTILDHAEMPALIIETGFLSNRTEARKLITASYQTKIIKAIIEGLKSYFNE